MLNTSVQYNLPVVNGTIENRKENIGVIEKKTGDILANIDEVRNDVIKHLNEVADKMKEKVTSSTFV
jgi:hypothetical protein